VIAPRRQERISASAVASFCSGIALNCLGVRMTESRANRLQGHPSVDQLGGVHVPELVDCGGNLRCRPVLGPQLSCGGIFHGHRRRN
jgi:hypothetical protein